MIYLDAAYIAKCYLNEPGAERVRALAAGARGLASCAIGRAEFFSVVHRHLREKNIRAQEARAVFRDFERDEQERVWQWLPVTAEVVRLVCARIRAMPTNVLVRAADALHLGCARHHGFEKVYTNDRRMLACAGHFDVVGENVLAEPA